MQTCSKRICLLLFLILGGTGSAGAAVKLPSVFADHLILQRDVPVPVWGTADAGEVVTVEFSGQKKSAAATATGHWQIFSGPLFRRSNVEGSRVRLQFSETGGGLCIGQAPWRAAGVVPLPTDRLTGFFIAGSDRQWRPAEAVIDGGCVVVSHPAVPQPAAVRYAWANSPQANLYNKEGLPASPFRTDDWPVATPRPSAAPKQP